MNQTNQFIKELHDLLKRHNATIYSDSSNSGSPLGISVSVDKGEEITIAEYSNRLDQTDLREHIEYHIKD